MAENGHGKTNGLHWTQTPEGRAKMALAQRRGWRKRRKNAKLKAAKQAAREQKKSKKVAKSIKRGLKQAIRHANGRPDRVSPMGFIDIKTAPKKLTAVEQKLFERGLMRLGAQARIEQLRSEERALQRFLQ